MLNKKNEREIKMNEIIELIQNENLSMLEACKRKDVCYTTFRSWIKGNPELKVQLLESKKFKINSKYETAIHEFLNDDITFTDLCNKYRIGINAFKKYIDVMKEEKIKQAIKDKIEQRRNGTDAQTLEKNKKLIEKAYEDIKTLANGKIIFAMDMLDLLIDMKIEEPSKYFVKKLEKEGYKVI